jgi:hypothetical protein
MNFVRLAATPLEGNCIRRIVAIDQTAERPRGRDG